MIRQRTEWEFSKLKNAQKLGERCRAVLPQDPTGASDAADTLIPYFWPPELEEFISAVFSHQFVVAASGDKSRHAVYLTGECPAILNCVFLTYTQGAKHDWGNPTKLWRLYTFQTFLLFRWHSSVSTAGCSSPASILDARETRAQLSSLSHSGL